MYHDRGNLNWAIIVSRALHDKDKELECIAAALRELGYPVEGGERGGLFFGQGACLSGLSGLSGRKVSGTARRFGTRTVLHHGTLLVSSDLEALANSLGGIATEADTSLPSVKADPANINQFSSPGTAFPLRDPMEAAFALSRILSDRNPEPCPGELLPKEFLEKEKSSLASREWIYDATPTFGFSLGNLENCFSFIVEKGRIRRVDGHKRNEFDPFEGSIFSIAIYLEMHAVAETLSRRKEDNR
ncbi:MAG: hypothetical protein FD137_2042 [Spirochaetes bacterium]|nr:MAG: hypothetical protein FD137_2042 [Spirochaetota bacterium]